MDDDNLGLSVSVDTAKFERALEGMTQATKSFSQVFSSEIQRSIQKGRSFEDTLKAVGLRLSDMALQAGLKPLENLTSNILGNIVASVSSATIGNGGGGVPGSVQPGFASPASKAVLSSSSQPMNVVFNIATPNVEGFKKSEGQMSAMLARSVGRARRTL